MSTFSRRRQRRDGETALAAEDEHQVQPNTVSAVSEDRSDSGARAGPSSPPATVDPPDAPGKPAAEQSLPGPLVVVDRDGRVLRVSKRCEQLFGPGWEGLLGTDLYSLVDQSDHAVLRRAIEGPDGRGVSSRRAIIAPPLVRIHASTGEIRLAELWEAGSSDDLDGSIVLLLRDRSVVYGINSALAWVLDGAPLAEGLLVIAQMLSCEPAGHTCYFVTADSDSGRAERIPDDPAVPGPPAAGPWALALWSALSSEHSTIAGLTPELQGLARADGYAALRCYPVLSPGSGLVTACLVAWSHEPGPLSEEAETAFRRALMAAGIALTMRPEEWQLTDADRVGKDDRDPVTGLPNARALVRSLDVLLSERSHPAVLCIGIRGLDEVRENFGPLAVGTVERAAAQRVHSKIRRTDDVYRYAEGTLAVIYEGKLAPDRLRGVAERILAHVTTPVRFGTSSVADIEASIGISVPSVANTTGDELVDQARVALESAWRHGPGRISFTVPSTAR